MIAAGVRGCLWYSGGRGYLRGLVTRGRPARLEIKHHTVEYGSFQIGLVEEGQIRSMRSCAIRSDLKTPAKVSYIITRGATVRKDVDVLMRFETKPLIDSLVAKRVELELAKRQLMVAQENIKIEQAAGQAAVSAATSALKTARGVLVVCPSNS